jgi:hypothetical protein
MTIAFYTLRPLTPALSPSDGERVAEGRVRGVRATRKIPVAHNPT